MSEEKFALVYKKVKIMAMVFVGLQLLSKNNKIKLIYLTAINILTKLLSNKVRSNLWYT